MDASLAEVFGIHVPIEQSSISGRTDRKIAHEQFRLHNIEDNAENWERFIAGYLRHLPASLVRNGGRILPGIERLLDDLAGRDDVAVGLLTGNHPEGARIKLEHFGIWRRFSFGAFGDLVHDRDDVARVALETALREVGPSVVPRRTWVIGDTPWDVRCAKAIGARSLAVATGIYSVEELREDQPDLALADLSDPAPFWRACAAD